MGKWSTDYRLDKDPKTISLNDICKSISRNISVYKSKEYPSMNLHPNDPVYQ